MIDWSSKYTDLINKWSKRINFKADLDLHPFFDRVHYAISGRYATLKQFKKAIKKIEYNLKKKKSSFIFFFFEIVGRFKTNP